MSILNQKNMPRLGAPPRRSPVLPMTIALALLAGIAAGVWFTLFRAEPATTPVPPTTSTQVLDAGALAQEPLPTTPVTPARPDRAVLSVTVDGPLESAIITAAGAEVGPALTQVISRALVWWIRVPQDLTRNDTLSVVYEIPADREPTLHAIRYVSGKKGQTFEAFRYQAPGAAFSRLYTAEGEELEERLVDSPLDAYEQVTSLLRDGRGHKGVDFKTPVGTPVKAPFDGVITRKNWNFRGNGNCLELTEAKGARVALFLHLSELPRTLAVGTRVSRGEVIARSGNSGHSFAPHLHYQLMQGERVLDPFTSHATARAALQPAQRAGFMAAKATLAGLLPPSTVTAAGAPVKD